jgi:hypothetical protein
MGEAGTTALEGPRRREGRRVGGPAACWPWTDGTGRRWQGWARLPLATPACLLYLAITWLLFASLAHRSDDGIYRIDLDQVRPYVYHIPDLTNDPLRAVRALLTAPFLNHDSVQLVYISLLVVLFGIVFEVREGTRRTVLLFAFGLVTGAFGAGLLLHLVYPDVTTAPLYATAWVRTWSGGSAGCFGVMGALAGRTRRPGPLLALLILWDLNWPLLRAALTDKREPQFDLVWWHVPHSYTSAFHLVALAAGFLVARYWLTPVVREPRRAAHPV